MARNVAPVSELQEKVVYINRVSKVVKGGRRFSLSALVVVGDGEGKIGIGMGKSSEVPNAIKKAIDDAKKNMFTVPVINGTLPHATVGEFGAARVVLKPAAPGCGVIAGGPARAVLELAGYTDVLTKSLGSPNPVNVVKATAEGLKSMQFSKDVAKRRGKTLHELFRIDDAIAAKKAAALKADELASVDDDWVSADELTGIETVTVGETVTVAGDDEVAVDAVEVAPEPEPTAAEVLTPEALEILAEV